MYLCGKIIPTELIMAKTVTKFTLNISGVVAYTNNQVASFGTWFDSAQKADLVGSATAFRSAFNSKNTQITALLALLAPATVTFSHPTTSDVTKAIAMVISGVVAYSDNTVGSFSLDARDDGSVNSFQGSTDFDNLAKDTVAKAQIKAAFDTLLSPTTVVVAG